MASASNRSTTTRFSKSSGACTISRKFQGPASASRSAGAWCIATAAASGSSRNLAAVILTTSAEEEEILTMYRHRCSSYIIKPADFDKFLKVVQLVSDYWFTVVVLPPEQRRL